MKNNKKYEYSWKRWKMRPLDHKTHGNNPEPMAEWSKAPDREPRFKVVSSIPSHATYFSSQIAKKINTAPSVRAIAIYSDSNNSYS